MEIVLRKPCLVERIRMRRSMDLVAAARVGRELPPTSPVLHDAAVPPVAGVVAVAARSLSGAGPAAGSPAGPASGSRLGPPPAGEVHRRHVAVIDPRSGQVELHPLVPVAACPACDPGGKAVVASHLESPRGKFACARADAARADAVRTASRKAEPNVRGEGAFRVEDPQATWERYSHLVGDVVGAVPHVSATGPAALRAFSAGPNVAAADDLVLLCGKLRSASGGKGLTLTAARTGALGTDAWVLDVTTHLGIPAAVAVAVGLEPMPRAPLLGFGAHLDPVIAVVRALTELAQMQAPLAALGRGATLELPGPTSGCLS